MAVVYGTGKSCKVFFLEGSLALEYVLVLIHDAYKVAAQVFVNHGKNLVHLRAVVRIVPASVNISPTLL